MSRRQRASGTDRSSCSASVPDAPDTRTHVHRTHALMCPPLQLDLPAARPVAAAGGLLGSPRVEDPVEVSLPTRHRSGAGAGVNPCYVWA